MNIAEQQAISQVAAAGVAPGQSPLSTRVPDEQGLVFNDVLQQMVNDVQAMQLNASQTLTSLDQPAAAPQDMATQMQQADQAYEIMMKIRHKLTDTFERLARSGKGRERAPA